MTMKEDFVHRRRRIYRPPGGSVGGGEENGDDVSDADRNSLTGSQEGGLFVRRTTRRLRCDNDEYTNFSAGTKLRRKSTSSISTSYRRRTTNAGSILSTVITSGSATGNAKGQQQQQTSYGSKVTQQQHPTNPIQSIPIRFAQSWNPSKLFLESSKIILDFLLYQQGILPCTIQQFEFTTFDATNHKADDPARGSNNHQQHRIHQKRRSSSRHSILLLQTRREIFSVWDDLFGSISTTTTTTTGQTPLFQQQELVISISFSVGGGSSSRNMDTYYLLRLQLPSQEDHDSSNNMNRQPTCSSSSSNHSHGIKINEGIRLHVVQPSPPLDRLARKLLTSIMSSDSSSSSQNENKNKTGSHPQPQPPPPPPARKQQQHTNAIVHVWMDNSSLEYLWQENHHHDDDGITILHNREDNSSGRTSTLKERRQLPLKPDNAFSKKLYHAMLHEQQQQRHQRRGRSRRQNVQFYVVDLQLPFNNSVKNNRESGAFSSAIAASCDDNHGVWMQVGRPLKRIEP